MKIGCPGMQTSLQGGIVKGKVIDIIVYLMQKIDETGKGFGHFDKLSEDLHGRGYTDSEIDAAFFWLLERLRLQLSRLSKGQKDIPKKSSRILHTTENILFSNNGYGYLIQLYQLGLINDEQREQIIQRAMLSGLEEIGESEVKLLVAKLLLSTDEGQIDPGRLMLLDESTEGTVH
jgi:uncharacterized protein Smg (DUF494 family)